MVDPSYIFEIQIVLLKIIQCRSFEFYFKTGFQIQKSKMVITICSDVSLWWINFFSGVWVVGNIGREQGGIWPTIIVSYLSYVSRWYFYDINTWLTIVTFFAALAFNQFSKEWRRKPRNFQSTSKRITTLVLCATLYIALWSSYFYFNGKITDTNGDEIPVHEAIHHFFTSPWWTDLKQSLIDIYQYAQHHGWSV